MASLKVMDQLTTPLPSQVLLSQVIYMYMHFPSQVKSFTCTCTVYVFTDVVSMINP